MPLSAYAWYVPAWRATRAYLHGRVDEARRLQREAVKLGRRDGPRVFERSLGPLAGPQAQPVAKGRRILNVVLPREVQPHGSGDDVWQRRQVDLIGVTRTEEIGQRQLVDFAVSDHGLAVVRGCPGHLVALPSNRCADVWLRLTKPAKQRQSNLAAGRGRAQ
jgi:hypothetical protein